MKNFVVSGILPYISVMMYKKLTQESLAELVQEIHQIKPAPFPWEDIEEIAKQEKGTYVLSNGMIMSAKIARDIIEAAQAYFEEQCK